MIEMENILHSYLCKMRIISKIPENGKLDITRNEVNIYYGGIVGWVYRKAYGDNKNNAVKFLLELYKEINSFSDQLIYNITTENSSEIKHKKIIMLVSLTEKIKESLNGIRNLIGTYKDYHKIVSMLECLEQDIIIPQYHNLINFIPKENHTKILQEPIKYEYVHTTGIFNRKDSPSSSQKECSENSIGDFINNTQK